MSSDAVSPEAGTSDEEPTSLDLDAETTGVVPVASVRLSDFVDGDPPLPLAYLLVVTGDARGETLVVDELPAVIGRANEADLVVADDTVSRRHAELRGDRAAVVLVDLGSSNGTTLNGNPMVGEVAVHDGDIVGFGSATVVVKRIS